MLGFAILCVAVVLLALITGWALVRLQRRVDALEESRAVDAEAFKGLGGGRRE